MSEQFGIIASWVGSLVAVCTGVGYLFKLAKAVSSVEENVKKIPELVKDVDSMKKEIRHNTLDTNRLVIINEKMPLDERLACGERYLNAGGNGAVHRLLDELKQVKEDEDYKQIKK